MTLGTDRQALLRRATLGAATLIAAIALAASPALAQPSQQDTDWMIAAHQSNLAEIAAGTAAQSQATSDDVRQMGAMLIADHKKLDADLTAAAQQLSVDLPDAPTPEQQAASRRSRPSRARPSTPPGSPRRSRATRRRSRRPSRRSTPVRTRPSSPWPRPRHRWSRSTFSTCSR
jgi:hypothetical protein